MTFSFVGKSEAGANATTITLTWPTVAAADFALVAWSTLSTSGPFTLAGFTFIGELDTSPRTMLYGRVCTGSETGNLVPTVTSTNRHSACLSVWRGFHPTLPVDAWSFLDETVSQSSHACPAVTPNYANGAIISGVGERASAGTTNWTTSGGYVERADTLTLATGTGGTITAVADDGLATAHSAGSPVTPPNWVSADPFSTANVNTWSLALRPPDAAAISSPPAQVRNRRMRQALLVR